VVSCGSGERRRTELDLGGGEPGCYQTLKATSHLEDDPGPPPSRLSNRSTEYSTQPSTRIVIFRAWSSSSIIFLRWVTGTSCPTQTSRRLLRRCTIASTLNTLPLDTARENRRSQPYGRPSAIITFTPAWGQSSSSHATGYNRPEKRTLVSAKKALIKGILRRFVTS